MMGMVIVRFMVMVVTTMCSVGFHLLLTVMLVG